MCKRCFTKNTNQIGFKGMAKRVVSAKFKRFETGQVIDVAFAPYRSDAEQVILFLIKKELARLLTLTNLKIRETSWDDAEIRIKVGDRYSGNWSYIGTDARFAPDHEPTMNIEDGDPTTIRHELCHGFLAWEHEQQFPNWIKFNEPKVIADMLKYYGWSEEMTRHNILNKIDPSTVETSSNPDKLSIMLYWLDPSWILEPTNWANLDIQDYSEDNIAAMKAQHPFPEYNIWKEFAKCLINTEKNFRGINESDLVQAAIKIGITDARTSDRKKNTIKKVIQKIKES